MKIRTHRDLEVYKLSFEAAETQTWLDFSQNCSYITEEEHHKLYESYDNTIGKLVNMSLHPAQWSW